MPIQRINAAGSDEHRRAVFDTHDVVSHTVPHDDSTSSRSATVTVLSTTPKLNPSSENVRDEEGGVFGSGENDRTGESNEKMSDLVCFL